MSKGMLVKLALLLAGVARPASAASRRAHLRPRSGGTRRIPRRRAADDLRTRSDGAHLVAPTLDDVQRLADTVGILYEGRLLMHGRLDEILSTTKRIRATLVDGHRPTSLPPGTIYDRVQGREWLLTVGDFRAEKVEQVRGLEGVEHVEVVDLGLEDLFKDIVKSQRAAP